MNYTEYVIEGNPGAGKSTVLGKVVKSLNKAGVRVHLHEPFRLVKERLKKERPGEDPLYDIWQSKNIPDAQMALKLLRESVEESRLEIAKVEGNGDAVLLCDRGWLTLLRVLEDMGVTADELETEKEFWFNSPAPDTFFLTTSPTISMEANKKRKLGADWRSAETVLQEDFDRRKALTEEFNERVIKVFEVSRLEQDRSPIATDIHNYIKTNLE